MEKPLLTKFQPHHKAFPATDKPKTLRHSIRKEHPWSRRNMCFSRLHIKIHEQVSVAHVKTTCKQEHLDSHFSMHSTPAETRNRINFPNSNCNLISTQILFCHPRQQLARTNFFPILDVEDAPMSTKEADTVLRSAANNWVALTHALCASFNNFFVNAPSVQVCKTTMKRQNMCQHNPISPVSILQRTPETKQKQAINAPQKTEQQDHRETKSHAF